MACKSYKRYSKEFKVEALRLAEQSDQPVTQIAREVGLRQNQIYKWRKELESKGGVAFPGKGHPADLDPEKTQLRKDLATAKEEMSTPKRAKMDSPINKKEKSRIPETKVILNESSFLYFF